jgi:hypothetical protein
MLGRVVTLSRVAVIPPFFVAVRPRAAEGIWNNGVCAPDKELDINLMSSNVFVRLRLLSRPAVGGGLSLFGFEFFERFCVFEGFFGLP